MVPKMDGLFSESRQNSQTTLNRRRSNIEIIADMLRAGENGAGKTHIMYSANMSYTQIQKYLDFLVNHEFLAKVDAEYPPVAYRVTDSGLKLLRLIDNLTDMLGTGEPVRY
jgi:predicted transcriptional regulator